MIKVQTIDSTAGEWCTEMVDNWLRLVGEDGWSIELQWVPSRGVFELRTAEGLLEIKPRSANEIHVGLEPR